MADDCCFSRTKFLIFYAHQRPLTRKIMADDYCLSKLLGMEEYCVSFVGLQSGLDPCKCTCNESRMFVLKVST